ncbi:MAG: hypothetical protein C0627_03395 [Sulfurimonas sp.]|nr:MAG: hypothetical protein C0627_03395 [Sulfurimonas sp.]
MKKITTLNKRRTQKKLSELIFKNFISEEVIRMGDMRKGFGAFINFHGAENGTYFCHIETHHGISQKNEYTKEELLVELNELRKYFNYKI